MQGTVVRLSMTLPGAAGIRWPELCSNCGEGGALSMAPSVRRAPPVPYCRQCHRVYTRWTRWIGFWVGFALLLNVGPLLIMGAFFDRPMPSLNSYHNLNLFYIDLTFFAIVCSSIAAALGYLRRSELQGVQVLAVPDGDMDNPTEPLSRSDSLVEIRFKNPAFYSATMEANRPA